MCDNGTHSFIRITKEYRNKLILKIDWRSDFYRTNSHSRGIKERKRPVPLLVLEGNTIHYTGKNGIHNKRLEIWKAAFKTQVTCLTLSFLVLFYEVTPFNKLTLHLPEFLPWFRCLFSFFYVYFNIFCSWFCRQIA